MLVVILFQRRLVAGLTAGASRDREEPCVAMVFQNYPLYPHMAVRENMGFALKLAKTPQQELDQKLNEAARILGLEQHLERKPAKLSRGQRQALGRPGRSSVTRACS